MTETTETTETTGPRPLFKAYDEAVAKNGWEFGGLTEKAVFALAFSKMMNAWAKISSFWSQDRVPLCDLFDWLYYGDGRNLWMALARAGVVCMTEVYGLHKETEGRRLAWLDDHLEKNAFWAVSECVRSGFRWKRTERCINELMHGVGCDDGVVLLDASPYRIPLNVVQKEGIDVEKIQAELKKLEVKK